MEFESIAGTLGLDWEIMLIFVFLNLACVEMTKEFGLRGRLLFIPGTLVPFLLNLAWFSEDGFINWQLLIFGTIIVTVVSMGGNAKLKNWLHKGGRASTREPKQEAE